MVPNILNIGIFTLAFPYFHLMTYLYPFDTYNYIEPESEDCPLDLIKKPTGFFYIYIYIYMYIYIYISL
jgi:hypothetical protein